MAQQAVSRNESEAAASLRALFGRLVLRHVKNWTSSQEVTEERPVVADLAEANIVTSRYNNGRSRHALVLDIDHPSWLVKSSTPGHFHLYVDVPGGIPHGTYLRLLNVLADAKVIESGYADASRFRGYSSVRLPWIKKEKD